MTRRGRFISFEGGEGAGKSTHVRRLTAWLQAAGINVLATREPGGPPGAEAIRALLLAAAEPPWSPLSEVLLHYAARREHLDKTIEPALARGTWVVCDRFADSTMAYQGYGQGVDRALIVAIHRLVLGDLAPDLTFVLDLPTDEGAARRGDRPADRYEALESSIHARIRQGFLAIAEAAPARCVVIDARQPLDAVDRAIEAIVARRYDLDRRPPGPPPP